MVEVFKAMVAVLQATSSSVMAPNQEALAFEQVLSPPIRTQGAAILCWKVPILQLLMLLMRM